MTKWEYAVFKKAGDGVLLNNERPPLVMPVAEFLKIKGDEGWELCLIESGAAGVAMYFKRPKQE